jgi:hypothetical protein
MGNYVAAAECGGGDTWGYLFAALLADDSMTKAFAWQG